LSRPLTISHPPIFHRFSHVSPSTIRHTLPCTKCGYDLEGLAATGNCPECGTPIVDSLTARLDTETRQFDDMPNPRRVAATVLFGALGALGGAGIFLAIVFERLAELSEIPALATLAPAFRSVAFLANFLGFIAFLVVLPWRRESRFVRAKALGVAGFTAWLIASFESEQSVATATYTAIPTMLVLFAIAPLLRALAPRSRAYRNARATAQRVEGLLLSTGIAGGTSATALLLRESPGGESAATLLSLLAVAAAGLTVVGLAYLSLNAFWLVRASFQPLLTVEETFGRRGSTADQPADRPRDQPPPSTSNRATRADSNPPKGSSPSADER
jgi:predicted RNA-binding Zn-ribbon protein involved in translation (DUF1610 family)